MSDTADLKHAQAQKPSVEVSNIAWFGQDITINEFPLRPIMWVGIWGNA